MEIKRLEDMLIEHLLFNFQEVFAKLEGMIYILKHVINKSKFKINIDIF